MKQLIIEIYCTLIWIQIIYTSVFANEAINYGTQKLEYCGFPLFITHEYFNYIKVIDLWNFYDHIPCFYGGEYTKWSYHLFSKCLLFYQIWKNTYILLETVRYVLPVTYITIFLYVWLISRQFCCSFNMFCSDTDVCTFHCWEVEILIFSSFVLLRIPLKFGIWLDDNWTIFGCKCIYMRFLIDNSFRETNTVSSKVALNLSYLLVAVGLLLWESSEYHNSNYSNWIQIYPSFGYTRRFLYGFHTKSYFSVF